MIHCSAQCKHPHLAHEPGDDPVEGGALVAEPLFSGTESTEVLCGSGDHVCCQLEEREKKKKVTLCTF